MCKSVIIIIIILIWNNESVPLKPLPCVNESVNERVNESLEPLPVCTCIWNIMCEPLPV